MGGKRPILYCSQIIVINVFLAFKKPEAEFFVSALSDGVQWCVERPIRIKMQSTQWMVINRKQTYNRTEALLY